MRDRRRAGRDRSADAPRVVLRELQLSFGHAVMAVDREKDDATLAMDREHAVRLSEMR